MMLSRNRILFIHRKTVKIKTVEITSWCRMINALMFSCEHDRWKAHYYEYCFRGFTSVNTLTMENTVMNFSTIFSLILTVIIFYTLFDSFSRQLAKCAQVLKYLFLIAIIIFSRRRLQQEGGRIRYWYSSNLHASPSWGL